MVHSRVLILCFLTVLPLTGRAPAQVDAKPPSIQDNSFLVEEAYNQEYGVVQHISAVSHTWDAKDWIYTLTQEWPVPGVRHQLSYTLAFQHAGAYPGSGMGIGDVLLNYRYQLVGDGQARIAVAPRLSLLCPTGSTTSGRGMGSFGVQTNLPASIVLLPKLVSHWNVGGTIVPAAQNAAGDHAFASGWNLGQSFIYLAKPRFNLMLETVYFGAQSVTSKDHTAWTRSLFLNPGVRWAYNFKNGLQIVPGIGVPVGLGPSAGEKGLFLYLSFEHPFRKLPGK
jgi:hypothetical protein